MCAGVGGDERLCPAAFGSGGKKHSLLGEGWLRESLGSPLNSSSLLAGLFLCLFSILWTWPRGLSPGTGQSLARRSCLSPSGNLGSGLSQTVSTQDAFLLLPRPSPAAKTTAHTQSPVMQLRVEPRCAVEWRQGLPALNRPRNSSAPGRLGGFLPRGNRVPRCAEIGLGRPEGRKANFARGLPDSLGSLEAENGGGRNPNHLGAR